MNIMVASQTEEQSKWKAHLTRSFEVSRIDPPTFSVPWRTQILQPRGCKLMYLKQVFRELLSQRALESYLRLHLG